MNILTLAAALKLDGTGFKAGLREAEVASARFGAKVAKDIGGKLTGAFAVGTLAMGAKSLIDFNSKIKDTATALDISTEALQEQQYWLTQNGASADALTGVYKGLSKARADALKGGEAGAKKMSLFEMMGIDAAELETSSIENIAKKAFEGFRTTDFGADKMAVALELFGKGATEILPALEASLADAAKEARSLGQIINGEVVDSLEQAGDEIDKLVGALRGPLSQALAWTAKGLRNAFTLFNLVYGTAASFAGGLSTGSLQAGKDRAAEFYNKTLADWEKANEPAEKRKRESSVFTTEPEPEKMPKEPRERMAREAADRGEPGRANEVAALTRTGQLSARDATLTARAPIEKAVDYMRQQLDVEKEQLKALRAIETKRADTIQGHF